MDAAQTTKKIPLFLTVALLFAGAASAQPTLTTSQGSNPTVTLSSLGQSQVTLQIQSSDNTTAIPFTLTKGSATWFSVSPTSGTTPQTIAITLTGACNTLGNTCTGSPVTVNSTAGKVTITVLGSNTGGGGGGGGGGSTLLSSSVNPINLNTQFVGGIATADNVQISTNSATAISVTTDFTPKNSWLNAFGGSTQVAANQPMTLFVQANSQFLAQNQTYTGSITVTPTGNSGQTLTIPVNFTVGTGSGVTGTLIPSQTSLGFGYPNGTQSASLTIGSSTGSTQTFNASTNSVNGWLLVNFNYSANGLSTGNANNLLVSLNASAAANLPTGVYNGTITLTNVNNSSDVTQIPVTLSINGASGGGTAGAAPTSLTFAYQQFKPAPPCQIVVVPNAGTYTVTPSGSPLFLYTSAGTEFTGPGFLQVCAAVANLTPGTYSNTVSITSSSGFGFSQSIPVTLNVYSGVVVNATVNNLTGTVACNFQSSGAGCNDSTLTVTASDNSNLAITVTPSASWITVTGGNTVTPANFSVHLNPSTLTNGVNTGSIVINASGASNGSLTVPVVVVVNGGTGGGGTGSLTLSTSSLTFGASTGTSQTLGVTATSATNFTVSTPSSGCSWLSLTPSGSLTTNQNITVTVSPAGLNAGQTYSCNISLVSSSGTQTVGVSYTVPSGASGNISSDKSSLTFSAQVGVAPAAQTINLTSASGSAGVSFSVTTPNTPWLTVSPTSGTTPAAITVTVNPTGLTTGSYAGSIVVAPVGGNAIPIPVSLLVVPATAVSATPTTLSFSYIAGSNNPASQTISVTGTGQNLPFIATVASGAEWLSVSPATGTAPATVTVSASPGNLTPNQTYSGQIVIAGTGIATGSTTVNVSLAVTAPLPTITTVVNAASSNTGPISAGEIISIMGTALGPATPVQPASGVTQFPTALGNVQVTVGGYLAPLTYVSNIQINAVVPYEISRPFIANPTVIVRYLNQGSNGVTIPQVAAAPGIFTTGGGTGQGAILNGNLSVNSASNPANKGEVIVLYVTGEGQTNPAGVTGKVTTVSPTPPVTPQPVSGAVSVTIDGIPASVQFYGEAPGLIAGAMQINVVVPAGASSGNPRIIVKVGDAPSQLTSSGQGAVTVAVR